MADLRVDELVHLRGTLQDNELTVIRDAVDCAVARPILDFEHDTALKQMAARNPTP